MNLTKAKTLLQRLADSILVISLLSCSSAPDMPIPDYKKIAEEHFQEDAQWYLDNVPFFECSDKQLEEVYYYRWKLYKAHIRNIGDDAYVITEFINHIGHDREPYCTINAASMHHIYEGRWLKDKRYMDGYIDYLYNNGGNDRRYSESIADAAYARYLVDADSVFVMDLLDSMKNSYNQWSDHWDANKNLYYIPVMPDATEYTIASIDASGGKDGFEGGDAFRPTINSYMYGNALAIARIANMKGDTVSSQEFLKKATHLKTTVEQNLWNDSLEHFTDRFKVNNKFVKYWDFIRGRELAGMVPWYFNLPSNDQKFHQAWKHVTDTSQLVGKFGLRTNEPSYEYYFKQFVFFEGQRGSQWNGPSWPYQTSQVLTGMANLLNNYDQNVIATSDYLKLLRLYTQQHYLPDGKINLVENYDPNNGGPIVYYYWSNHYNHSSYNNLIISGLCGIRPDASDSLIINPLVDSSIQYFRLSELIYHGHNLTIVYDQDGSKYNIGKGLTVFVDGKKRKVTQNQGKYRVLIGDPVVTKGSRQPHNAALNIRRKDYPIPSASVNSIPDSLYQAIDGKIWYFSEIRNRWTTYGSTTGKDWFALDFGKPVEISSLKIYLFADNKTFDAPDSMRIEYQTGGQWLPVSLLENKPNKPVGNTINTLVFDTVKTSNIRIHFSHDNQQVAISEVECN